MRIERIQVEAFGTLSGFDTGPESLGRLVVVLGPNEAGKSTLHTFLATALYGFRPASRERNPHIPWGAEEAAGHVRVRLDDGAEATVERRLRSAPSARVVQGSVVTELRNQPLPWVDHVTRAVFDRVFAISLAELASLDDDVWGRIQDRIVGAMGSSDLASARGVADALEKEASAIWRPNRRGNQRLRDVQEALRALRGRRSSALERDRRIREIVEERDNVEVRLREVKATRLEQRVALDRVQTLLPVRRQLARIEALRSQGGSRDELLGLPERPLEALERAHAEEARLRGRLERLEAALAEPAATRERFGPAEESLVAAAEEIDRLVAMARDTARDRAAVRELPHEIERCEVELRDAGERLLTTGWRDEHTERVRALSVDLLADRTTRASVSPANEPKDAPAPPDRSGSRRLALPASLGTFAAGALLLGWSLAAGGPGWATPAGALLLLFAALVALLAARRIAEGASAATDDPGTREAARATADVGRMLSGLPIRPEYLDPPSEALVAEVRRLKELSTTRAELGGRLERAASAVAALDRAATALARAIGRASDPSGETIVTTLERELRDVERLRHAARAAEGECRRLEAEAAGLREDLTGALARTAALTRRFRTLGGDASAGAAEAERRMEAHRRADQLRDELERQHPNLPELADRIREEEDRGAAWIRNEGDVTRLKDHLEEIDEQIERLVSESRRLERDATHLRDQETVDAVDSEIDTLRETEAGLARERDRAWVLARLLREADRRFREEHQPDLVRRASRHLAHLTGGRYDRILIEEGCADGPFRIFGPALPAPVPLAPPLSTGTLEQAYLSLRLAIVDHLDDGRERLPLFVDEALVNWDRGRRERGLGTLADLSSGRQTFVFTCHPEIAAPLEASGARVVRLDRTA